MHTYTLFELLHFLKSSIEETFTNPLWLTAEINSFTEHHSGHCYLELVQKANEKNTVIAQTRATIWSNNYLYIKKYFEGVTKTKLRSGISVLIKVSVDFHEIYGFSLNIKDIDPNYTLGDLERRKKEIIEKLKQDGVFDMNKNLNLPPVIQRIAVISSQTAAGYEDFVSQLKNNNYNYNFSHKLFQSDMQGANTENSVINSYSDIYNEIENFDVVVIIRGGGSKTDLSYFDNYNIASFTAQFPLPILSGIGHDRDESVTDMVSYKNFKTPTAVADFIIENNKLFENCLENIYNNIVYGIKNTLQSNELLLSNASLKILKVKDFLKDKMEQNNRLHLRLINIINNKFSNENIKIEKITNKICLSVKMNLNKKESSLNIYEKRIDSANPLNVLKRGYTCTKLNGKFLKDSDDIKTDDILETITYNTVISSKVIEKNKVYHRPIVKDSD